jgi:hypothetical protein
MSKVAKRLDQGNDAATRMTEATEGAAPVQDLRGASASRGQATPAGKTDGARNGSADWLGRSLRRLYQGTVEEPIPRKFLELLDRLDQQDEQSQEGRDGASDPAKAGNKP